MKISRVPEITASEYQKRQKFLQEYNKSYQNGLRIATEKIIKTGNSMSLSASGEAKEAVATALLRLLDKVPTDCKPLEILIDPQKGYKEKLKNALCSAIILDNDISCETYTHIYCVGMDLQNATEVYDIKLSNILNHSYIDAPRLVKIAFSATIAIRDILEGSADAFDLKSIFPRLCAELIYVALELYDFAKIQLSNDCIPVLQAMINHWDHVNYEGFIEEELIKSVKRNNDNMDEKSICSAIDELVDIGAVQKYSYNNRTSYSLKERISFINSM